MYGVHTSIRHIFSYPSLIRLGGFAKGKKRLLMYSVLRTLYGVVVVVAPVLVLISSNLLPISLTIKNFGKQPTPSSHRRWRTSCPHRLSRWVCRDPRILSAHTDFLLCRRIPIYISPRSRMPPTIGPRMYQAPSSAAESTGTDISNPAKRLPSHRASIAG